MDRRKLAASLAASLLYASSALAAAAPAATARIASDFAGWAGSRQNAEALVAGLTQGKSIAIATTGRDRHVSLAGFTPRGAMSLGEAQSALDAARAALARIGVRHPTAEQIQAALIGGEVRSANGRARTLPGTVAVLGGNPQLASR